METRTRTILEYAGSMVLIGLLTLLGSILISAVFIGVFAKTKIHHDGPGFNFLNAQLHPSQPGLSPSFHQKQEDTP